MCQMIHNPNLFAKLLPLCKRINKCSKTQLRWCMENTKQPCKNIIKEMTR